MGVEATGNVFVNMANQNYNWHEPNGGGGWQTITSGNVDANGWPTVDARWTNDYRPFAEWAGQIDDPEQYRIDYSGTYKCSFKGQADVSGSSCTISNAGYDANTNITTFDMFISPPAPYHGYFEIIFENTKRTPASPVGSGLSELRVIRPGYPLDTSQVFTDEFIRCLKNAAFSTIRFMGVAQTNGNTSWDAVGPTYQSWSIRKKTTDATQVTIPTLNKKDGWAWEYIVELCNIVDMDLWLCIPVAVDDDYLLQLAQLIYNNLDSHLNVYIEHSNEIWNWGFNQYAWNVAAAQDEVDAGGSNLNYDGETEPMYWGARRHARRTMEAVNIFASVFGSGEINNRIRGVVAGKAANETFFKAGNLSNMLTYLDDNYGDPCDYIYAISMVLYYGSDASHGNPDYNDANVAEIVASMRDGSDAAVPDRQDVIDLANDYNLPGGVCCYEGGPSIGVGETSNLANRIMAVRDLAQKDVYKRNFADNFWDLGGNLAMQFTLASSYNRYGTWGLTDDLKYPDRNYLFQAVRELLGNILKQSDFNLDWIVNIEDLNTMAADWMAADGYEGGAQNPGTDDLVAQWALDDAAGDDTNDSSGNAHHGRLGSAAGPDSNDPNWVNDPERGWCLYFDGNDFVFCGGGKNVGADPCDPCTWTDPLTWADFNAGSFTLSAFVKQTETLNWATFIGKGELEYKLQFGFLPWLERRVHFAFPRTAGAAVVSSGALPNNQWHHIAGVWDADAEAAYVYVNAVLDGTKDYAAENPNDVNILGDSDCDVLIGARVNEDWIAGDIRTKIGGCPQQGEYADSYFSGYLSDIQMYKRALIDKEIEFLAGGVYIPLDSPANIYDEEIPGSKAVDFKDFSILADEWMVQP